MSKKIIGLGIIALCVLVVVGIIFGCGTGQNGGAVAFGGIGVGGGPNTGTVSGKVINFYTGQAIQGVTVTDGTVTATTDANGDYTLSGVSSGTIIVSATASNYSVVSMKANNATMNFALFPPLSSLSGGTLNVTVESNSGSPVAGMVTVTNGKYGKTASKGVEPYYVVSNAPIGDIILAQESNATMAAFSVNTLSEGQTKWATLTYPQDSQYGTILGTITTPNGYAAFNKGACYVSFTNTDLIAMPLFSSAWMGYGESTGANSLRLRRQATANNTEYQIFVLSGTAEAGSSGYSLAARRTTLNAGQQISLDFDLPEILTATAPLDGATGTGATPVLSWTNPWSSSASGYMVFVFPSNATSIESSWIGITADTSIQVPPLADLQAGQEYMWTVVGADIPGFTLSETDLTNLAQLSDAKFATSKYFSKFVP